MAKIKSEPYFFDFAINDSEQPVYMQLYASIRESILSGRLTPGMKLPPSRSISENLKISRTTVLSAFDKLFSEGYLTGKAGSGTFVAENLPENLLHSQAVTQKSKSPTKIKTRLSDYGMRAGKSFYVLPPEESVVPFQPGVPALTDFPRNLWLKLYSKIVNTIRTDEMTYTFPEGMSELRKAVASYLRRSRAVKCDAENVIIVNGSQQALDLTCRVLLNPGDHVMIEDPGYRGAFEVFHSIGARVDFVRVDEHGIQVDKFLSNPSDARMIYVTPSHQYPLGATLSLERRLKLLEWAAKKKTWIIEDDYDSEYRFAGRPLASLQGLDENKRVIYVGTFSKVLFPAVRVGYLVVPSELIDVFKAAKALCDRNTPVIEQLMLARFIEEGYFGRHIRKMRMLYDERQSLVISEIEKHFGNKAFVRRSNAGLHTVMHLDKKYLDVKISKRAKENGIIANPLSSFCRKRTDLNGLILGYAAFDTKEIKSGIERLAELIL